MNRIADARAEDAGSLSNFRSPYFSQEHEMLRAQVRRFVETEIKPKALAWEEQGYVPREVLRRMVSLGFLGIRYPARYGGSASRRVLFHRSGSNSSTRRAGRVQTRSRTSRR